jgi:Leucine-rich repeat (LRR) protein
VNNQITDAGAVALSKNTTLRQLNLEDNQITNAGAISLSKNTTLRQLDLGSNQIEIILMNKQLIKIISRLVKKEFWSFY